MEIMVNSILQCLVVKNDNYGKCILTFKRNIKLSFHIL